MKQNWHRILSAFAVLLVVCSIAFSCGVNAKAYEISPKDYSPYSFYFYDDRGDVVKEVTIDPNEASSTQGFPANFNFEVNGVSNGAYVLTHTTDPMSGSALVSFFNEVEIENSWWNAREVNLSFNCLDFTPCARSGYLDRIIINRGTFVAYTDSFSPLNYIWPSYSCSDVDYTPPITDIIIEYSYLDGSIIRSNAERHQFYLYDAAEVTRSTESILDQLLLDYLPDNSWITSVSIDLVPIITDFTRTYPDANEYLSFEVIQLERRADAAEMSARFLANLLSPSISVPDTEGTYQEGYIDGLNKGQTESLGVVDWLVEAGDSFMNFQLFKVGATPVSVGTLFSVIIGTFLIFFILRLFAGG